MYDAMIERFQETEIVELLKLLPDAEISRKLRYDSPRKNLKIVLRVLEPKTTNTVLKSLVTDLLGQSDEDIKVAGKASRFQGKVDSVRI